MKKLLKLLLPDTSPVRLAYHRAKALIAAIRYGFPARKLTVIGITGTDGKTTTVGMVAHILNACGIKTGALSTAFFQVGSEIRWNPTQKTSPSPFLVQKFLRELVNAGCTHAVIECSSHGLLQGRVNHLHPKVAAITNVSEEHLDYHGIMDEYIAAKTLLFRMLRQGGTKVLNMDDVSYEILYLTPTAESLYYSPMFDLKNIRATTGSVEATATIQKISVTAAPLPPQGERLGEGDLREETTLKSRDEYKDYALLLRIPGTFNLSNALCAILCATAGTGISTEWAVRALASFKGIPGRIEPIDAGQDFSVFVDFTVTPQSYQATLTTLRSTLAPGKRLLVLCGSCGDRMKEKRPIVGGIVSSLADVMVVTNEDPYTEDPETIIDQVIAGVVSTMPVFKNPSEVTAGLNKFCVHISGRMEAIRYILSQAKSGDIVLLSGKGSDTTMMTKDGQVEWNEREIVKRELGSKN